MKTEKEMRLAEGILATADLRAQKVILPRFAAVLKESAAARRRVAELENTILWALGENGDFAQRSEGAGAYWWRTELRKRRDESANRSQ